MKRLATLFAVILTVSACDQQKESSVPQNTNEANGYEFGGVETVLLVGRHDVDVMQLMAPREAQELSIKIQNAAASDPKWWKQHVKNGKPGQPLPYDPKLGVTEAEFNRFLELSNKLTMQKQAVAKVTISRPSDGKFVFDGGADLPKLTGIQVDLLNDEVFTPFGVATTRSEIDAPENSALGKWKGVQWIFEQVDQDARTGTSVKISIGTHGSSGRGIVYYDVKHAAPNAGPEVFYHVLMFDLSDAKSEP